MNLFLYPMSIITYPLIGILWLTLGYNLGKLANWLFMDDNPKENLSLIKRGLRFLLFPINYFDWQKKLDSGNNTYRGSSGISIRDTFDADYLDKKGTAQAMENYARFCSFFWPLNYGITLIVALILIFVLNIWKTVCFVLDLPRYLVDGLKKLAETKKGSGFKTESVTELKSFKDQELKKYLEKLDYALVDKKARITELEESRQRWHKIASSHPAGQNNALRFEIMINLLKAHKQQKIEESIALENNIRIITAKMEDLDIYIQTLEEYDRTSRLLSDTEDAATIKAEYKTILDAAQAAAEVCRQAYSIETTQLSKLDVPVETIADQIVEGHEVPEEIRRTIEKSVLA